MIFESITELTGRTPTVRVRSFDALWSRSIFLKLESYNPSSSIKDRVALGLIEDAERKGLLKPGGTIVESTSGNLGKALAQIGASKGYKVIVVVDPKVSPSVVSFCKAFGAVVDVVTTPDAQGGYQKTRLQRVQQLLAEIPGAYWPNQYDNPANPRTHATTTAQEIAADFPELDYLVASVSTGGHLSGIARVLKQRTPTLKVIAVDAHGSSVFGFPFKPFLLNGIGLAWKPGNIETRYIDSVSLVKDEDAFSSCRLLAAREGIFVGGSSGAVFFACLTVALQHTAREDRPARVLGITADTGCNYLDTIYNDQWISDHRIPLATDAGTLIARAAANELISIDKAPIASLPAERDTSAVG